jgi:hypothetical protein
MGTQIPFWEENTSSLTPRAVSPIIQSTQHQLARLRYDFFKCPKFQISNFKKKKKNEFEFKFKIENLKNILKKYFKKRSQIFKLCKYIALLKYIIYF